MVDRVTTLIPRFLAGDRAALAQVITLIESTASEDLSAKIAALRALEGAHRDTIRVAISGPPGVGKSTFINALGQIFVARGYAVAVLPIDPSSTLSFGSILGDKARMKELASLKDAYIRPSPSKGVLGGLSPFTRDVMLAAEAFGYNVIIIETVGIGQSEMMAKLLADHFVMLMQPGAGDELQAIKKGILEMGDFILVNKADGEQEKMAKKTLSTLKNLAQNPLGEQGPYVASLSAQTGIGIDAFFEHLLKRHAQLKESGQLNENRHQQFEKYFKQEFVSTLARKISEMPTVSQLCADKARAIKNTHASTIPEIEALVDELSQKLLRTLGPTSKA